MRFTIPAVNQKAIMDNNLNGKVKLTHLAVMEVIVTYFGTDHTERLTDKNGEWYWVSNKWIVNELPMLDISEDRCRQLITELCQVGLLERHPNNTSNKKTFLRKGPNFLLLHSSKNEPVKKQAGSEKNDQQPELVDKEAANKQADEAVKKQAANPNTNCIPSTNNSSFTETGKNEEDGKIEKSYQNFKDWLKEEAPIVLKMDQPITLEEYRRLLDDFYKNGHWPKITETLIAMHNRKGLTKDYVSANLTLRNWVKTRIDNKKSFQQKDATGGFQVGNVDYLKYMKTTSK